MKILIAEDDAVTRRRLESNLLNWDYEVLVAKDGDEAWRALQGEDAPRLAILDWMMPGMDGIKVCEEARKLKGEPYIYILILTAKGRKVDIIQGLDAGADDYLIKPYDAHELKARLRAGRRILALQEALLSARDALRFQATLDPLTGLWNRNAILATLKRELLRAERQGSALAIFMADFDGFNQVNETYGYLAGDSVLREAADRIRSVSRLYDAVGRYGGEEFIIIAPGCEISEAVTQAERIRASISDKAVDQSEGMIYLTLSVGAVAIDREHAITDPNLLIRASVTALSRAKELGANRVELARAEDVQGLASAKLLGANARRRFEDVDSREVRSA
jgi:two-component system cell cycle response regulator